MWSKASKAAFGPRVQEDPRHICADVSFARRPRRHSLEHKNGVSNTAVSGIDAMKNFSCSVRGDRKHNMACFRRVYKHRSITSFSAHAGTVFCFSCSRPPDRYQNVKSELEAQQKLERIRAERQSSSMGRVSVPAVHTKANRGGGRARRNSKQGGA